MPTGCNRGFYCRSYCLLNMFRASPCPSSGAQEYYTVVTACGILCSGFSSSWSGVEMRVMRPVCSIQHPANRTHNPQLHTRSAGWCPKHVEQAIRSAIKTSAASSWHFISTYYKYPSIYYSISFISNVCKLVKNSWQWVQSETIVKSLKKCGISNALDGSEDDILYEESDALSENNREDNFSSSDDDFLGFYDE